MALLINATLGFTAALSVGAPPVFGAVGACALSTLAGGGSGALNAGVLVEVWTGELIKKLKADELGKWLDGIPDYSECVENDVIHMVDVGGDPDVLIDNTSYPIDIQALTDTDAVFKLAKFQTKATPITDDELYALSYDKMSSAKERHGDAIEVEESASRACSGLAHG